VLSQDITQESLATAMGVSRFSVNQIINGRRTITAEMALRLARVLGTTPEFWLNLQQGVDIHEARERLGEEIERLPILRVPRTEEARFAAIEDLVSVEI
jgi:addiction module HigA family antidote